ncbi:MAG: hypothetical protein ABII00_15730 [Elusimicrobiota bacterium]
MTKTAKKKTTTKARTNGTPSKAMLGKEISSLGKKIQLAVKHAAKSKRVTAIRSQIKKDIRDIGTQMKDAIKAAKDSDDRNAIERQAKKVVDLGKKQAREAISKLKKQGGRKAAELGDNVWRGLETSAFELGKLSEKIKTKVKKTAAKAKKK